MGPDFGPSPEKAFGSDMGLNSVIILSVLKLKFQIIIIRAGRRSKVSLLYSYLKSKPMLAIFGGILSFFWRFIGPNIRQLSHLLRGLLIVRIIKSVRDLGIGQQEKRIFYFDLGQKRPTPSMVIRRPSKYGHKRNHVIVKMCDFKYDICLSTVIKTL